MRLFHEEIKSTKESRKKMTRRLRALQSLVAWHYLLLGLSATNALLTLFVVVNTNTTWRGTLLLLVGVSLVIWLYLLISGLSK